MSRPSAWNARRKSRVLVTSILSGKGPYSASGLSVGDPRRPGCRSRSPRSPPTRPLASRVEELTSASASGYHSLAMSLTQSRNQRSCWLLALLLFGSAWGGLWVRTRPGGSACAAGARACCCTRAGMRHCCFAGQDGAAAQLASLSACAGASDLPSLLLTPPPAWFAPASVGVAALPAGRAVPSAPSPAPPSATPQPPTPPPQ